ncbi:MAG: protein jag [Endomicrobiales bacterium]|nr:protein jag [Endomicrobiales bacterium]
MNHREIEVEGKTVEAAIASGLEKFSLKREQVDIKILSEGSSGLFGLMGAKPARVQLAVKNGVTVKEILPPLDFNLSQKRVKEILETLLSKMNVSFSAVHTSVVDGLIAAEVKSSQSALLIGKSGQTLKSVEYLCTLILNRDPLTRVKVRLDVDNYLRRCEQNLLDMVKDAAQKVTASSNSIYLHPMNSSDRKIVHNFLKDDPKLETFSDGYGAKRKVGIRIKKS